MKNLRYYPNSDMLLITLRDVPASGGGEDATEGTSKEIPAVRPHRQRLYVLTGQPLVDRLPGLTAIVRVEDAITGSSGEDTLVTCPYDQCPYVQVS